MTLRRVALGAALVSILWTTTTPALAQAAPATDSVERQVVVTGAYTPQDADERGLWMQMDEQERLLKTSNFVIRDAALNAYVRQVFCRVVGPRCGEIRIYLMHTAYFNSTTAPNGVMQIWSGLLLRTRNEAQLAAVLAHEYAHYQYRHSLMLFRQAKAKAASATFLAMFGLVGALVALGEVSDVFRFSRDQETQADDASITMMAAAGYDPAEAAKMWEQVRAEQDATALARAAKSRKDKTGGMFATHPPSAERVARLTAAAQAMPPGNWRTGEAEYHAAMAPFWAVLIDDQIKLNDFGGSDFLITYLGRGGWSPPLNYARGELYRSRGRLDDLKAASGYYREASLGADAPVETWRGLGLSLLRSGDASGGQAALKTYLERRPDAPDKPMIAMLAGVAQ